ncbi:hypothetical protein AHF37_04484 [Paragonimus kellicotti]|nr:hypothetical protein AHF37_04484 [Paragonimus kellicotti]
MTLRCRCPTSDPRELDVGRLLDACKQLHPLNVLTEPDVQQLDRFLSRLNEWRQSVRKTAACVCRLSLTTATRNLVMHCPITYEDIDCKQMEHLSSDEQVLVLLSRVLNINEEFPGFAPRLPEWALLNLLNRAVKWLCIYQKQSGEDEQSIWTLPQLRQHSNVGENLLSQLNEYGTSRKPNSNSRNTTPSSNSTLEVTMAPVSRLLQARMHTALGRLSQLIVQVDSLITILCETLGVPGSFSCSEAQIVLGQFQSLKVNHLVMWDFPGSQNKGADSGANEKTLITGSSTSDFKTTINVDSLLKASVPSVEATQPSELVLRLHALLAGRVRQLLTQHFDRTYEPITSRPQLTQVLDSSCSFCPLISSLAISQEDHLELKNLLSQPSVLCTPHAVALSGHVNQIDEWKQSVDTLLRSNTAVLDSITEHMDPMFVNRLAEVRRTVACIPSAPNSVRDSRSVYEQSKLLVNQLQTMLGVGLTFSIRLEMECRFLRRLVSVLMPKANSN